MGREPGSCRAQNEMSGAYAKACFTRERETVQKMQALLLLGFIACIAVDALCYGEQV